ncbi:hypothetical protein PR048_005232 [Dryococelus australis]|uniref:Uncharacterized protein n=1 Tax=Dryococelus australis TaxID=614101 RepID=A0ABQ9I7N4_9NEOP|nr:hypothetical protein PR048_005232 [Dryococelus australis]
MGNSEEHCVHHKPMYTERHDYDRLADEGELRNHGVGTKCKGGGNRRSPRKPAEHQHRSGTILTFKNLEPGSPRWGVSSLTTIPPRFINLLRCSLLDVCLGDPEIEAGRESPPLDIHPSIPQPAILAAGRSFGVSERKFLIAEILPTSRDWSASTPLIKYAIQSIKATDSVRSILFVRCCVDSSDDTARGSIYASVGLGRRNTDRDQRLQRLGSVTPSQSYIKWGLSDSVDRAISSGALVAQWIEIFQVGPQLLSGYNYIKWGLSGSMDRAVTSGVLVAQWIERFQVGPQWLKVQGEIPDYLSVDKVMDTEQSTTFPVEFRDSLQLSGSRQLAEKGLSRPMRGRAEVVGYTAGNNTGNQASNQAGRSAPLPSP